LLSDVLIRVKNTTALGQLGETERELEVRNAFELNLKYKDAHASTLG
jgi:predicted amidophosphoribosyltransferase